MSLFRAHGRLVAAASGRPRHAQSGSRAGKAAGEDQAAQRTTLARKIERSVHTIAVTQETDMTDTEQAREQLIEDFSAVLADSEVLLKAMASAGGEKAQALRTDLERKLRDARMRIDAIQDEAGERARAAA